MTLKVQCLGALDVSDSNTNHSSALNSFKMVLKKHQRKKKNIPIDKKNCTLIHFLLFQFQIIAYLGLGILIVAPFSEHPDPAIKISTACKVTMELTKSQLHNQKTELCANPHGQPNEPLVILLCSVHRQTGPLTGAGISHTQQELLLTSPTASPTQEMEPSTSRRSRGFQSASWSKSVRTCQHAQDESQLKPQEKLVQKRRKEEVSLWKEEELTKKDKTRTQWKHRGKWCIGQVPSIRMFLITRKK